MKWNQSHNGSMSIIRILHFLMEKLWIKIKLLIYIDGNFLLDETTRVYSVDLHTFGILVSVISAVEVSYIYPETNPGKLYIFWRLFIKNFIIFSVIFIHLLFCFLWIKITVLIYILYGTTMTTSSEMHYHNSRSIYPPFILLLNLLVIVY